jgi:hypothetical protein
MEVKVVSEMYPVRDANHKTSSILHLSNILKQYQSYRFSTDSQCTNILLATSHYTIKMQQSQE